MFGERFEAHPQTTPGRLGGSSRRGTALLSIFPARSKILVIGASGFIGTALRRALVRAGAQVHCFSRTMPLEADNEDVARWTLGDMADGEALARCVAGNDLVIHLAHTSLPAESNLDPIKEVGENVCGTLKILNACVRGGVHKVVFASSGGTVYGVPRALPIPENATTNPLAAYGISKLCIEKYLFLYNHLHQLDYQILRISNPFGPCQSPFRPQGLVASLVHRGLAGAPVDVFGDGSIVRDFVFIDDVVRAVIASLQYDGCEKVMNVGAGLGRSIAEVIKEVERALGRRLPVNRRLERKVDVSANVLDIELIRRETGWRPLVTFGEGVERTVAWMRSHHAPSVGCVA